MSDGGGENGSGGATRSIHVVMFPWLAFGHISPFAQLARKLISGGRRGVRVTFLTAAGNVPRVEAMLPESGAMTVAPLHLPHVPGLPPDAASTAELPPEGAELLKTALDGTRPQVAALLAALRPDAVLIDFATPWVCDVAAPLGATVLYFCVFSAACSAYVGVPTRLPHHDLTAAPAGFPPASPFASVPAYQAKDLAYLFASFHGMPSVHARITASIRASAGLVFKTCPETEGPYIDYISSQWGKPVLLAGPVVPEPPPQHAGEGLEEPWASWLASFPDEAVVFASFGSETFLPAAAATELLLGLEATGRPFLAVLNFPRGADDELRACVPPGFEERVEGRGKVHTGWVQQQLILRHRSVGCFVNHAGFSSVVEGLVAGCRLVLLPIRGDQYFNAALFGRELRVGVEVARRDEDGWFGRQDVSDAVTAAMGCHQGNDNTDKWRHFFTNDAVQEKFADDFVTTLKEFVIQKPGNATAT